MVEGVGAEPCPECREEFQTEHGMKVHYGLTHEGSLATEESECLECGCVFEYNPHDRNGMFCRSCLDAQEHPNELVHKHRLIDNRGKKNPMYGVERSEEVKQALRDAFTGHTQSEEVREKMAERWRGVTGPDHPAWKGGYTDGIPYGGNWIERREEAIERAGGRCSVCGKTRDESREEHGKDLSVHHRTPRAFYYYHPFLTVEEHGNHLDNLEVVCPTHHTKHDADPWHGTHGVTSKHDRENEN